MTFNDNGSILVIGEDLRFKGLFDYSVKTTNTPTGSIQFSDIGDVNGDDIRDFEVLYGTGERQIVFQMPE